MTAHKTDAKTVIAYILLFIDVMTLFYCGDGIAQSKARHHEKIPVVPDGMYLTVDKEISFEYTRGREIVVPVGTVVLPGYMYFDSVHFYYSLNGISIDELKKTVKSVQGQLDVLYDMGILCWHADLDCFKERDQLKQISEEAERTTRSMQREAFWNSFVPFIFIGLLVLAVGFIVTLLLSTMRWFALLYGIDVVAFFVICIRSLSIWCH